MQYDMFSTFPFTHREYYQKTSPGTGLHPRPPSASKLHKHFPRVSIDGHDPLLYASRNGETFAGIHERAEAFFKLLLEYMKERHPKVKRILLVSHAATVIALGRAIVGDRGMAVRAGTCSLSKYVRRETRNGEKWECELNGWTGHLARGEQVSLHECYTTLEEYKLMGVGISPWPTATLGL